MYKEDPVKIQTYDIGSEEQTNNIIQSIFRGGYRKNRFATFY